MQDKIIASHTCFGGTWILTVKLVDKLSDVPDDLILHFFTHPPPIHPYFCQCIFVFTRPNDGWTGLYIKLCFRSSGTFESL